MVGGGVGGRNVLEYVYEGVCNSMREFCVDIDWSR